MSYHRARTISYLRSLTAGFLARQAKRGTLLTVTDFTLSRDGKRAAAYLSVWPEDSEAAVLRQTKSWYGPWRELVERQTNRRLAPRIDFVIDERAKATRRVDKLSAELKINAV